MNCKVCDLICKLTSQQITKKKKILNKERMKKEIFNFNKQQQIMFEEIENTTKLWHNKKYRLIVTHFVNRILNKTR